MRRVAFLQMQLLKEKLVQLLIYLTQKKIMTLKLALTLNDGEISSILNLLSSDLEIFNDLPGTIDTFSSLLKSITCICILYLILGPIGLVGLFVSFLHIPLIIILVSFMLSAKNSANKFTDLRTGKMKNFIEGAQILKLFA